MSVNSAEVQETILNAIDAIIQQRNNELKLDKTITAIVKKNAGFRNGRPVYQVQYEGGLFQATANTDDTYSPNIAVYVLIPQGNFSNEKFIIGRANSISTERSSNVVAAAVNKYSIIGSNLLENCGTYGLHSFHQTKFEKLEPQDHSSQEWQEWNTEKNIIENHAREHSKHKNLLLYSADDTINENGISFNKNNLSILKEDATALMIKADFRTVLDVIQTRQSSAKYGLIFSFAFDNLNAGHGETQGEVLEYVASIVKGKVINSEGNTENKTLQEYINEIEQKLEQSANIDYIMFYEYIQALYNNFLVNDEKLNTELIKNTVTAYLNLLSDMSIENNRDYYLSWKNKKIGESKYKLEQFVLTSDDMLGNPFQFSKWNTQYSVFTVDLETIQYLDSIVFFQQGFYQDYYSEQIWPPSEPGNDIFVKNIQIYAMKPLDAQTGDYSLKVEPTNNQSSILSSENTTTQFKATVLRKLVENLTYNSNTTLYWFKENSNIINSSSNGYNYLAGAGWSKLSFDGQQWVFNTTFDDNFAYKNNYKCVAIYNTDDGDEIILSTIFSVYNIDRKTDIRLVSDLGVEFSFDAGNPTITAELSLNDEEFTEIIPTQDNGYRYIWAVVDASNGETIFLNDTQEDENFLLPSVKRTLLSNIKLYQGNNIIENSTIATRIQYPVSVTSSGFTVACYLQKNGIDVGSATLEFLNKSENVASDYRISIINGDQVFQYDEYGTSPTHEKNKHPLEILPLQCKLYSPSGIEVQDINYRVEWIFELENTLIIPKEELIENPRTELPQMYKGYSCNFDIAELYNPDCYNNQITCHVTFGNKDLYKDTTFYFGKQGNNGTNGTDIVAKIEYTGNDSANILHYQPLTVYICPDENNNQYILYNVLQNDTSQPLGQTNFDPQTGINQTGILKTILYQQGKKLGEDAFKTGYPKWNIAGNTKQAGNNLGKYYKLTTDINNIILNFKPDFNIDKKYLISNIKSETIVNTGETYYAFFSLPIIKYENMVDNNKIKAGRGIAIDRSSYLNEIIYNADGRNPIYNHNQGLKLLNLPNNCTIEWKACGGFNNDESIPDFQLIFKEDEEGNIIQNQVWVLPNDEYSGSHTNNYIKAKIKQNDILIVTVYAPIHMALNTFGLASLNAWDGNSVAIDEDNGYVMAPQIGAGEKDSNNRFTGILMGKTETYTGQQDNEKQTGLLGYSHGLQSIFLDADTGDATFGLPDGYILDTSSQTPVPREEEDNYNEGRVELRPGGESKIGGWRMGRRSLYYTSKQVNNEWRYSGELGAKYSDTDASHHERDIEHTDQGILLSAAPAYMSIKGKPLTSDEISDSSDSQIVEGDSMELQLDPLNTALFAIYKHHNDQRELLSGINTKGQLVANRMEQAPVGGGGTRTGLAIESIIAFDNNWDEDTESEIGFIGASFEAANGRNVGAGALTTEDFFDAFIGKQYAGKEEGHVYITGGQFGQNNNKNDYTKSFSVHGKSIGLFVTDQRSTEYTTDRNVQITPAEAIIQLGANTLFNLKYNDTNILKTLKSFNINIGTDNSKESLNISAGKLTSNYQGIDITNTINNININNSKTFNINNTENINIKKIINNDTKTHLILDTDSVKIGIPSNGSRLGEITLQQGNVANTWEATGPIQLTSNSESPRAGLIWITPTGIGNAHNGISNPQFEIRIGKNEYDNKGNNHTAKILLSSSNDNWTARDPSSGKYVEGIPIKLEYNDIGVELRTSVIENTNDRYWNWHVGTHETIMGGLYIEGVYAAESNAFIADTSIIAKNNIHTNKDAYGITFKDNSYTGTNGNISYTATGATLAKLIIDCLQAAAKAKSAADAAQSTANTAISNAAAAQSTANTAVSDAAAAQSTANTAASDATSAKNELKNCLKKNTSYTYDTPVMTATTTSSVIINGQTAISSVTDHITRTFKVS